MTSASPHILQQGLEEDGHQVELSYRGDDGRDMVTSEYFDAGISREDELAIKDTFCGPTSFSSTST
jgi:hypothetical protein